MRYKPDLIVSLKWGISLTLPAALMTFLFDKADGEFIPVFLLGFGLCVALLFVFRLVSIPVTKEEFQEDKEKFIIGKVLNELGKLEMEAKESRNRRVLESARAMIEHTTTLSRLLASDEFESLSLVTELHNLVTGMKSRLQECVRLALSPEDEIFDGFVGEVQLVQATIITMIEEYRAGRLLELETAWKSLARQLAMKGYKRSDDE